VGAFVFLFSTIFLDYLKCVQRTKYVEWDLKTITASDYTAMFDFSKAQYELFQANFLDETLPIPEIVQLRMYIKNELEARLSNMRALELDIEMRDDPYRMNQDDVEVKVATVQFAYNNSQVINWLKERGDSIKAEDWPRLEAINDRIRQSLKGDQEFLDTLQRPCTAFITFETADGIEQAVQYNQQVAENEEFRDYEYFLGGKIVISRAPEPSDIIWQNRHFTDWERLLKKIVVSLAILLMLTASFAVIFVLQKASLRLKNRYP
jgi:hypothetical protein